MVGSTIGNTLNVSCNHLKTFFITPLLILFVSILLSCRQHPIEIEYYPNDKSISNSTGEPKDSLTFYYPRFIKTDSQIIVSNIDSFNNKQYSYTLKELKEPILFNYYQGHDMYRFLWLRAFNPAVAITLNKDGDKVWLTTKKLDRRVQYIEAGRINISPPKGVKVDTVQLNNNYLEADSIAKYERHGNIIVDKKKNLSIETWNKFEQLLSQCNYWNTPPAETRLLVDGSRWIIEAHLMNRYWIVERASPKDNYRKCGEYLLDLSELTEDRY